MKKPVLILGILLLFAFEIMRVYFIMPFPGSQQGDSVSFAYFLSNNLIYIRLLLLAIIAYPAALVILDGKWWKKVLLVLVLALYGGVFYLFNYKFLAEKIFYQPRHKEFATATSNKIPTDQLVIGVVVNGEARAYPIQLMGYHHQVQDTINNEPVMVTYCTVCRTGTVFSPMVNGKHETFRLVGMDHFNAMFEDATTKSWWRQVSGEAIAGPLKGTQLKVLPSEQMTLAAWLRTYPNSLVLQPDPDFARHYAGLEGYGKGTIHGGIEGTDIESWHPKSWVIGVTYNGVSKAYDWNTLIKQQVIQDSLNGLSLLLLVEKDSASFHVYDRRVDGHTLQFISVSSDIVDFSHLPSTRYDSLLEDTHTHSWWNMSGSCFAGDLKGKQLPHIQAYQEFYHSWKTFHPNTLEYK